MADVEENQASEPISAEINLGPYERWIGGPGGQYKKNRRPFGDLALIGLAEFSEEEKPVAYEPLVSVLIENESGVEKKQPSKIVTAVASDLEHSRGLRIMPFALVPIEQTGQDINLATNVSLFSGTTLNSFSSLLAAGALEAAIRSTDAGAEGIGGARGPSGASDNDAKKAVSALDNSKKKRQAIQFTAGHPVPVARINQDFIPGAAPPKPRKLPACKKILEKDQPPRLVIVGVIDDGLPFAHRNFLGSDGETRVDYCWLQGSNVLGQGQTEDIDFDTSVAFGKELTGKTIQHLIKKHSNDEDDIYADPVSGAVTSDPDTARNIFQAYTHGAHVMEAAGGFVPDDEGFEERDAVRIVGVQLPRTSLQDTSGFGKEAFILSGVHYILDRAERIAKSLGKKDAIVLINISLGATGGPKNGKSLIERAIDEAVEAYGTDKSRLKHVKVFLPSGNNYASQIAAQATLSARNPTATVEWHLQPNDRTPNFVEFWFDAKSEDLETVASSISMTLTSPAGNEIKFSKRNADGRNWIISPLAIDAKSEQIGQMSLDRSAGRYRFMLVLAPTEYDDLSKAAPIAPAGTWSIKFTLEKVDTLNAVTLYGVIQRDEDPAGTGTGGRQSYFGTTPAAVEKDIYKTHDKQGRRIADENHKPSPGKFSISGNRTINGWATKGDATSNPASRECVAGFTGKMNSHGELIVAEPATYSASGTRDGSEPKVDSSALSNRSNVLSGINGSGTRSGSTQVLIGTSAAAPSRLRRYLMDVRYPTSVPTTHQVQAAPIPKPRLGAVSLRGRKKIASVASASVAKAKSSLTQKPKV